MPAPSNLFWRFSLSPEQQRDRLAAEIERVLIATEQVRGGVTPAQRVQIKARARGLATEAK